jgi:hypothetical protein
MKSANFAVTCPEDVCPGSCDYLRRAIYCFRLRLSARSILVLVGYYAARIRRSTADRRDACWCNRCGACALVPAHVRIYWQRHAGTVRSATPTRDSRTVPIRTKPNVHRGWARTCRRGDFLPINVVRDLRRLVSSHGASVRGLLRRTDAAANVRIRVRGILRQRRALATRLGGH